MLAESSGGGGVSAAGGEQMLHNVRQNDGNFYGSGGFGSVAGSGQAVFPSVHQNSNGGRGNQEFLGNGQMSSKVGGGVHCETDAGPTFFSNVHANVEGGFFTENGRSSPNGDQTVQTRGNPDGSEFNRHTTTVGEAFSTSRMNGVLLCLDDLNTRTASPTHISTGTIEPSLPHNGAVPSNGKGPTNGTWAHGPEARPGTTALVDVHPKDPRPQRLATLGLFLTAFGALLVLTSLCTSQWARIEGLAGGYLGPFFICQDTYNGYTECQAHSSYQPAHAAVLAGVCSALCFLLALWSTVLSVALVWMHSSGHRVLLKFKHTTALRMVSTGMAGFLSFGAVVTFVIEVTLVSAVVVRQSPSAHSFSWGFYIQVLATLVLWAAGGVSSAEWQQSRKLGGDPTMVNRDPQGLHAHTISNPNFKEDLPNQSVRTVSATVKNVLPLAVRSTSPDNRCTSPVPHSSSPSQRPHLPDVRSTSPSIKSLSSNSSLSPTGRSPSPPKNPSYKKAKTALPTPIEIHKSNGVSGISGQPYILGTQSSTHGYPVHSPTAPVPTKRSIFDFNNKIIKNKVPRSRSRSPVGRSAGARSRSNDGRSPKNARKTQSRSEDPLAFVPFDPNRAPLRSSLRKPKTQTFLPPSDGATADNTDGGNEEGGIPNPAFAQNSPVMKKKVRIHTQSTAV
ncbi:hypothetical protein FHG87_010951 [Trinorchestia longiramus]|nr:hypothetical protein FHG87_010951 [Trinorchestia longiramus]